MSDFNPYELINIAADAGLDIILKLLGSILFWIVGRWLIKLAVYYAEQVLDLQEDQTLKRYIISAVSALLTIALVAAIFGFLGVQTTTFAALLASAGVAIGVAWSGLLANFAAGAFMVVLRPFKVGDFVTAGGITGTVVEIGLFVTIIDGMDNVNTIVGNNAIFSGVIRNFSANPYRRVELVAQLNHSVEPSEAIEVLRSRIDTIPNVMSDPVPQIEILEFNLAGPVLAVRPFCHNDYYWDVYFATNAAIRDAFGDAGFPVPEKHYHLRQKLEQV
ncbi:MAG: mechanosensitive ion channel family protein [Myxococcota bacterium]